MLHVRAPALRCVGDVRHTREPVLLVPGTGIGGVTEFRWGLQKALRVDGRPSCTLDLPLDGLGDIQHSAATVVAAIRVLHRRTGRRLAVVAHSQGGVDVRWALRFWPAERRHVRDVVTLGAPQHGVPAFNVACAGGPCAPALWQMSVGSQLLRVLNPGPDVYGPTAWTSIYSRTDEIVPGTPPRPSSLLSGAANIAVQDVCPHRGVSHLRLIIDVVAYAAVLDALRHPGPARRARLSRHLCAHAQAPHLGLKAIARGVASVGRAQGLITVHARLIAGEPQIRPYAR